MHMKKKETNTPERPQLFQTKGCIGHHTILAVPKVVVEKKGQAGDGWRGVWGETLIGDTKDKGKTRVRRERSKGRQHSET